MWTFEHKFCHNFVFVFNADVLNKCFDSVERKVMAEICLCLQRFRNKLVTLLLRKRRQTKH